ncbi:MAG TPA: 50S ribosomal protein L23 [Euryarchaeota archaeon]|nr:50S ribosomal protein L23 [archaeon BMS3Bbin15]HDL15884.1 50S ribosomal protein L23 [Euryarchaeota archaeon]
MHHEEIIIYPTVTEKTMKTLETENRFVFMVKRQANKRQIKEAVESLYEVKVTSVRTLITPKGEKKAFVRLAPEFKAEEIATRIGIF